MHLCVTHHDPMRVEQALILRTNLMNLDTITVDMDVMDKTPVVMTLMVRGSIPRGPTTLSLPCHFVSYNVHIYVRRRTWDSFLAGQVVGYILQFS